MDDDDRTSDMAEYERVWEKMAVMSSDELARLHRWNQLFNRSGVVVEIALRAFVVAAAGAAAGLVFLGDEVRGAGLKLAGIIAVVWFAAGLVRFAAYGRLTAVTKD